MRFVTYNIQYSKGKDGVYDLARIAGEIEGADVGELLQLISDIDQVDVGIVDVQSRGAELTRDGAIAALVEIAPPDLSNPHRTVVRVIDGAN